MRDFRLAFVLLVTLALSACGNLNVLEGAAASTTPSSVQVQVAVNGFNAVETGGALATTYCTAKPMPAPCTVAAVTKLHTALLAGRTARNSLLAYAQGNTGVANVANLYTALTTATQTVQTITTQLGVKS